MLHDSNGLPLMHLSSAVEPDSSYRAPFSTNIQRTLDFSSCCCHERSWETARFIFNLVETHEKNGAQPWKMKQMQPLGEARRLLLCEDA